MYGRIGCISLIIKKEKKGKRRKVDNLWVDDFFGKIIICIFCVVFILGDIIKIFL